MDSKPGVDYQALQPVCKIAVNQLDGVFLDANYRLILTSTTEGKHSRNSLHYHGLAFDIRTRQVSEEHKESLKKACKEKLAWLLKKFQLVDEGTHFHIEYGRRA